MDMLSAPAIPITIGHRTRVFRVFVTTASAHLDAPATLTLYSSTLSDVAGFAADDFKIEQTVPTSLARLVLVDVLEFTWQRARCRQAGHHLTPADPRLLRFATLQEWLWARLGRSFILGTGRF